MDADLQLESFRRQWQQELVTKKSSVGCRGRQAVGAESDVPAGPSGCSTGGSDQDKHVTVQSVTCQNTYGPFSIVGNLLEEQNSKITQPSDDECVDETNNHDAIHVSRKRQQTPQHIRNHEKQQYKKLKRTRLKDIFVNRQEAELPNERLLDKLISDIDEITEIPFFDINLPRELAVKIFQFLDMKDLCHCAQVSSSWGCIANDELLWCRICHMLGHEKIYTTKEKTNWKQIVRHNVERQRSLVTNWKNRTGKLSTLEHVKGKILTAVHSQGQTVVAGYTNGEVKLWDMSTGDSCIFQPSCRALLVGDDDTGLQPNYAHSVMTAGSTTVATYSGKVDIWNIKAGVQPIQSCTTPTAFHLTPGTCLSEDGDTLLMSYRGYIDILSHSITGNKFSLLHQLDTGSDVKHIKLFPTDSDTPTVIFSNQSCVRLYTLAAHGSTYTGEMTEIHNVFGAAVDLLDYNVEQSTLAVGLGPDTLGTLDSGLKVKVYDIKTAKLIQTLEGHGWKLTCMNLLESPVNQLVTGSYDKQVRVFDTRSSHAVQSFRTRLPIYQVQMDDWKLVTGAEDGFLQVWDRRMNSQLWELHNRHPVMYTHYDDKFLIAANISRYKTPVEDEFDNVVHRRYRGSINVYNFLEDLTTKDVPEICLSTYDEPDASKYNIALAMPYDTLTF